MRPYGLPRVPEFEFPDVADIGCAGFKSSVGCLPGKGGEYRGIQRSKNRQSARRIWKRRARRDGRAEIRSALELGRV